MGSSANPLLTLPDDHRYAFKEPLGPIYTDADRLLETVTGPLVTVGDVVTATLTAAGATPRVAIIDGQTHRGAIDESVAHQLETMPGERVAVHNPPATITAQAVTAIIDGLETHEPTILVVEGEEDLLAVPVVIAAPDGTAVVYGQPNEGMVIISVDKESRQRARYLLELFDGEVEKTLARLTPR